MHADTRGDWSRAGCRMISRKRGGGNTARLRVLCLGCHSDDIEIGCGGTVLRLAEEYPNSVFDWVVFSAIGVRTAEARQSAARFVGLSRLNGPVLTTFRDGFMPLESI